MTLTLLLDLDDTLLENDINLFLPHYLKALGTQLKEYVAPEKMASELLSATGQMIRNSYPDHTLEEIFDRHFYPKIGVEKKDVIDVLHEFYENKFPLLQPLTHPRPGAIELVNSAITSGYTLVVATNPVFPLRAIQHRLNWAGLAVDSHPYALVSSFETFHFTKPNPAYYAECLAQLGWPDQPAVMVGNSLSEDLTPAAALDLPGFWISTSPEPLPESLPKASRKGNLEQVPSWLGEIYSTLSRPTLESQEAILAVLKSTAAALDTFSRQLSADSWSFRLQPAEWCFTEILCHLRDSDREINLPRVDRILEEQNAFVTAINADAWSETRGYCSENGPEALKGFIASRIELLQKLESLSTQDWNSPARHAIFGPTTLKELISFTAQHDRTHIQQAYQTLRSAAQTQ